MPLLCVVENPSILQLDLHIHGSFITGFHIFVVNHDDGSHSTAVFIGKKKDQCISGAQQFKPVLFKGQLYAAKLIWESFSFQD